VFKPRWSRFVALSLMGAATAATVACGAPDAGSPVAPLQAAQGLDDVIEAKGGKASWSLLGIIGHDNDLSASTPRYRQAAQSLARINGLNSALVIDTPGQDGVEVMGFNGQWVASRDKEVNTGGSEFVGTFMNWSAKNFPSDNRMLVLADHGGGIVRGIMVDDSSNHAGIRIPDLATVLNQQHAQIVAFDACLMQMIEVAYELRGSADTIIAAESVTYAGSWPYEAIGSALAQGGGPDQAAHRVVDAIGPHVYRSTVSAVRTAGAQSTAGALDQFAKVAIDKMRANPRFKEELAGAVARGQSYKFSDNPHYSLYNGYRDMISTARSLQKVADPDIAGAAREVERAAKAMVIRSWRDEGHYPDSNGVSFYAPVDGTVDLGYAKNSALARDTQWDEFLVALNSRGNFGNPLQKDKYPTAFPRFIYPGK
jgi:hypothetical protein